MKYEITKEQILQLNGCIKKESVDCLLEEWFPEAFKPVLEVGKWYKWVDGDIYVLWYITKIENKTIYAYGFLCDEWKNEGVAYSKLHFEEALQELKKATESEVFEALKKEAIKRGFKDGDYFIEPTNAFMCSQKKRLLKGVVKLYNIDCNSLFFSDSVSLIFKDGIWGTAFETITKEEAEKLLNKKII